MKYKYKCHSVKFPCDLHRVGTRLTAVVSGGAVESRGAALHSSSPLLPDADSGGDEGMEENWNEG